MSGVYREIYYHVAKITRSFGKDLASMNHVKQNMQQFLHQWVSQECIGCQKLCDCRISFFGENYWVMMNNSLLFDGRHFQKGDDCGYIVVAKSNNSIQTLHLQPFFLPQSTPILFTRKCPQKLSGDNIKISLLNNIVDSRQVPSSLFTQPRLASSKKKTRQLKKE